MGSDTAGHVCGKVTEGPLPYCPKHFVIQKRRAEAALQKQRARAARTETAWRARTVPRLPQMRVQLENAKREYERRTGSPVQDRAAYGGAMHPSLRRARQGQLSDQNIARVVELQRIIERLESDIIRAEQPTT